MQYKIDETARSMATGGTSRRGALKTLFAGVLGVAGLAAIGEAEAGRRGRKGKKGKKKKGNGTVNGGGGGYATCPYGPCSDIYGPYCDQGCECVVEQGGYQGTCQLVCPEYCTYGCVEYTNECIVECKGNCSQYAPDCGYGCECDLDPYSYSYETCVEVKRNPA